MYKIRKGCPIWGARTDPPPPLGKPILGLPGTHPCSLRETLLPWPPVGVREGWSPAPRKGRQSGQDPIAPAQPHASCPPHPHHSPQQTQGHWTLNTTADTGGRGCPRRRALEDCALLPWLFHRGRAEHSPDGLVKHCLQAPLSQGRALQVLDRAWGQRGRGPRGGGA